MRKVYKLSIMLGKTTCKHIGESICRIKGGQAGDGELKRAAVETDKVLNIALLGRAGYDYVMDFAAFQQLHNAVVLAELADDFNIHAKPSYLCGCAVGCIKLKAQLVKFSRKVNNLRMVVAVNAYQNARPLAAAGMRELKAG